MKFYHPLLSLIALLILPLILAGCDGSELRSDVPLADLQAVVEPLVTHADHLDTLDADYVRFNFSGAEAANESLIRQSVSGTSLDEYGLFLANDQLTTDQLADICEAYLKQRNDAWLGLYMVEEYPKLRDAEVKVIGQYVVYLILSEDDKTEVIEAIENALK